MEIYKAYAAMEGLATAVAAEERNFFTKFGRTQVILKEFFLKFFVNFRIFINIPEKGFFHSTTSPIPWFSSTITMVSLKGKYIVYIIQYTINYSFQIFY